MSRIHRYALIAALGALPGAAAAQPPQSNPDVVEHDFLDAEEVEGGRATAWLERLPARIRRPRRTLIRPRTSFNDALRTSLEDL